MVFRRAGRPTWYFQAKTRHGWTSLSTGTPDRRLAEKIATMWETLAGDERAWDCLDPVLARQRKIGTLFDLWRESGRKVAVLRRLLNDVDLEPLVSDFLTVHAKKVKPDSLNHIRYHLRTLLPAGVPFPRSSATVETLTTRLYEYDGEPGTIRKVHSDWSVFFTYCTDVRDLFERSPMEKVERPAIVAAPIRFYELDTVQRIVGWQPSDERRALFALLYGTGMEISVALKLQRSDVHPGRRELRAAGSKTHTRDRVARVADWAWDAFWAHAGAVLPGVRLFAGVPSRWTASDWHGETVKALEFPDRYPMKNARHHWAARMLRSGTPVAVVQRQLGHATAKLTLDTYGQFLPLGSDRDRWEEAATNYDADRREAK